jgi:hypothetical protein
VQYNETMSKWLAAVAFVLVGAGCKYGAAEFACTKDEECQGGARAGGRCEPDILQCSFPDTSCTPSGRRLGDLSGGQSGQCVGGTSPDGGIDTPAAPACFGTGLLRICLPATPTDALTIPVLTLIDTDTSQMCATVTSGGNYCVLAGTTITISAKLRANGVRPLVLLATDSITSTTNGLIDVGSHNGASPEAGAGADPAACVAGVTGGTSAGGAGGSFLGKGGDGGRGGGMNGGGGGGATAAVTVTSVTELRGGCAGQDGDGVGMAKGQKGHGGGAVFLIAVTKIDLQGGINAVGEGGGPGVTGSAGGGGGGAGGMIGFDAPMIVVNSLLLASGGGGGEGSGISTLGDPGSDPTTTAAAPGGKGKSNIGGDGGDGSANTVAATGGTGGPGSMAMGGGGGGGGGGAGLIKAPATATLGNQLSPPAAP